MKGITLSYIIFNILGGMMNCRMLTVFSSLSFSTLSFLISLSIIFAPFSTVVNGRM